MKSAQKKWCKGMLTAGAALLLIGLIWAYDVGAAPGLPQRLAGFLCGLGGSLAAIGGGAMLFRLLAGEKSAREKALRMEDERGLAVAYRAQSAAAIAAVLMLVAIMVVALLRGDGLYTTLGTAACTVVAAVKMIAWVLYDRKM